MIAADGSFADALLPVLFSQAAVAAGSHADVLLLTCMPRVFYARLIAAGYG